MRQEDRVRFRRPARDPRLVHTLQLLLIGSAVMAVLSLWRILQGLATVIEAADALKASVTTGGDEAALATVQVLVNLVYFAFGLLTIALIAIPIRYAALVRAMWLGHPASLAAVRVTAIVQLVLTVVGLVAVLLIFGGTGFVEVGISASMFMPAIILWYSFIPATRRWFSDYKVEALVAPGFRQVDLPAAGDPE